ncbi:MULTISPECIES: WXG100 family type VII secretion target [unclassified Streptosporangium]|uniref:WXG100 family type VII secretion target n=1 Tax=unclassified Streptosporangium TaxID=2632669 RepID=UPI002E2C5F5B|nr:MULTISPECIES: WXG100 family type VII secretion target [unclassified Streptosporangium]
MDFNGYSTDSPALQLAAGDVVDTAQYIEGLRQGVRTVTEELTGSGWLGAASGKFRSAMTRWDEQMLIVRRDLETIAENMGASAVSYSAADQDVDAGMSMVDSLINTPGEPRTAAV